ncbi:MAG TPA: choice-of-anchor E domain-containing protein [Verrucomicrobiae bacterium]|nr:choice-of-anchor E domain-containing protein [Verrucomicrobiae bacterium]
MKSWNLISGALVIGTVLATGARSAQAAMESQVIDYGSASSPVAGGDTVNLSFNKFDPSLGTLTDIILTLSSVDTVQSVVFDPNGGGNGYTAASVSGGMETVNALNGLSTSTASLAAGPFAGVTTGANTIAGSSTQTLSASTHVLPADFSSYTGGAGTFDVSVVTGTATSSGSYLGNELFFGWNANSYGSVEIDYDFAAVPEPGTWFAGLSVLGVCGVSLLRRKSAVGC